MESMFRGVDEPVHVYRKQVNVEPFTIEPALRVFAGYNEGFIVIHFNQFG